MGRVPDLKRIAKEDYPAEYRDLVGKLSFPINSFMEQVRALFDKGIDTTNLTEDYIPLKVQTTSTGAPITSLSFKSPLKNRLRGLYIISGSITSGTNEYITDMPFISFTQNGNIVTINNISNLQPEKTYEFLLRIVS